METPSKALVVVLHIVNSYMSLGTLIVYQILKLTPSYLSADNEQTLKSICFFLVLSYFIFYTIVHYQKRLYEKNVLKDIVRGKDGKLPSGILALIQVSGIINFAGYIWALYFLNKGGDSVWWMLADMACISFLLHFFSEKIGSGLALSKYQGTKNSSEKYPDFDHFYHGSL